MKLDHEKMLHEIDALVNSDMGFSVTSKTEDKPTWTQEEAGWMAHTIGQIYLISHCMNCTACQPRWQLAPWNDPNVRWVCESHPTKEQEHRLWPFFWRRCGGAGMPEPLQEVTHLHCECGYKYHIVPPVPIPENCEMCGRKLAR